MFDVVIIGSGVIGMYSAYLAAEKDLSFIVLEATDEIGGQLVKLYPEKYIYDIGGHPSIKAYEYVDKLKEQLNRVEVSTSSFRMNTKVDDIIKNNEGFTIKLENGSDIETKFILITVGPGELIPRELGIKNEFMLDNIEYSVTIKEDYNNKDVVIFGGGDSALDWADSLLDNAKSVTLVHRRHEFRGKDKMAQEIEKKGVNLFLNYAYKDSVIIDDIIKSITLMENDTKQEVILNTDCVLVFFGLQQNKVTFNSVDLEVSGNKFVIDSSSKTNIKGIYAAGDSVIYDGKVNSITCGNGEAFKAITAIKKYYKEK